MVLTYFYDSNNKPLFSCQIWAGAMKTDLCLIVHALFDIRVGEQDQTAGLAYGQPGGRSITCIFEWALLVPWCTNVRKTELIRLSAYATLIRLPVYV